MAKALANSSSNMSVKETMVFDDEPWISYDTVDAENDPQVLNVSTSPAEGKAVKRKLFEDVQEDNEHQGRKKQKTGVKSNVDPESKLKSTSTSSEHNGLTVKISKGNSEEKALAAKTDKSEKVDDDTSDDKHPKLEVPLLVSMTHTADEGDKPSYSVKSSAYFQNLRSTKVAAKQNVIKIKVPAPPPKSSRFSVAQMLTETLDEMDIPRKGVTVIKVIRNLEAKFDYHNVSHIKRQIKSGLKAGEYVKTTGVGLSGKFKPATKKTVPKDKNV